MTSANRGRDHSLHNRKALDHWLTTRTHTHIYRHTQTHTWLLFYGTVYPGCCSEPVLDCLGRFVGTFHMTIAAECFPRWVLCVLFVLARAVCVFWGGLDGPNTGVIGPSITAHTVWLDWEPEPCSSIMEHSAGIKPLRRGECMHVCETHYK